MSSTKKGSPKLGSVPSWFKRLQNKSDKMKRKENKKALANNPDHSSPLRIRKSHSWNWH